MRKILYYTLLPLAQLLDSILKPIFPKYYRERGKQYREARAKYDALLAEIKERTEIIEKFKSAVREMWEQNPPQGIQIFENGKLVERPSFVN